MKRFYLLLALAATLCPAKGAAQTQTPATPQRTASAPQLTPSSPRAKLFEQYLSHAATEYNGLAEISIPLYTIEVDGVQVPISLNYHASGIKYKQYDGYVGVGWTLSADGFGVSRDIHGLADEEWDFFDRDEFESEKLNSRGSGGLYDDLDEDYHGDAYLARINNIAHGQDNYIWEFPITRLWPNEPDMFPIQDAGTDIFSYMTPTASGHFLITDRASRSTTNVEGNPDLVELSGEYNIAVENIKITDRHGNAYHFGGTQGGMALVERPNGTNVNASSNTGWPLRKVVTPNNREIQFEYVQKTYSDLFGYKYRNRTLVINEADIVAPITNQYTELGPPQINDAITDYNIVSSGEALFTSSHNEWVAKKITTDLVEVEFVRGTSSGESRLIREIVVRNKADGSVIKRIIFEYDERVEDGANWHTLLKLVEIRGDQYWKQGEVYQFRYYDGPSDRSIVYSFADKWGYYKPRESAPRGPDNMMLFVDQSHMNDEICWSTSWSSIYSTRFSYQKLSDIPFLKSNPGIWVDRSNNPSPQYFSLREIIFPTGGRTTYGYEANEIPLDVYSPGQKVRGAGQRIREMVSYTNDDSVALRTVYDYSVGRPLFEITPQNFVDEDYVFHFYHNGGLESHDLEFSASMLPYRNYHATPMFGEAWSNHVSYDTVTKTMNDGQAGRIVSEYVNHPAIFAGTLLNGEGLDYSQSLMNYGHLEYKDRPLNLTAISKYAPGMHSILGKRRYYDADGDIVREEDYRYKRTGEAVYDNLNMFRVFSLDNSYNRVFNLGSVYYKGPELTWRGRYVRSLYSYYDYKIETGTHLPLGRTVTENGIVTEENYTYDDRNQIAAVTVNTSEGGSIVTENKYPYHNDVYHDAMVDKHMISRVIESVTSRGGTEIERMKTNYSAIRGMILPGSVQRSSTGAGALQTEVTYDSYDRYGNPTQYTGRDGIAITVIWSYKGNYPLAEIRNATYDAVAAKIPATTLDAISDRLVPTPGDIVLLNGLRAQLPDAFVTTYEYRPATGVTKVTDPAGAVTAYDYDHMGRLTGIAAMEGNTKRLLETYSYGYAVDRNHPVASMTCPARITQYSPLNMSFSCDKPGLKRYNILIIELGSGTILHQEGRETEDNLVTLEFKDTRRIGNIRVECTVTSLVEPTMNYSSNTVRRDVSIYDGEAGKIGFTLVSRYMDGNDYVAEWRLRNIGSGGMNFIVQKQLYGGTAYIEIEGHGTYPYSGEGREELYVSFNSSGTVTVKFRIAGGASGACGMSIDYHEMPGAPDISDRDNHPGVNTNEF